MDVLAFHQVEGVNASVGISARLAVLTQSMAAHRHDFWELAFAVKGYGHHEDEQARLPSLSGDVWVIHPGQWHAYPLVRGSLSIYNLLFSCDFVTTHAPALRQLRCLEPLLDYSPTQPVRHLRLSPQGLDRIYTLLETLTHELQQAHLPGFEALCTGLALLILAQLDRYGIVDTQWQTQLLTARHDPGLLAAICMIEERYGEQLTLEELARQSGYTPAYLARKFRQQLGVPPIDYLLQVRLQHACALLQTTNLSVTSIAHQVGFTDSRYFATRFRQAMGTTPSQYRDQEHAQNHTHTG